MPADLVRIRGEAARRGPVPPSPPGVRSRKVSTGRLEAGGSEAGIAAGRRCWRSISKGGVFGFRPGLEAGAVRGWEGVGGALFRTKPQILHDIRDEQRARTVPRRPNNSKFH